MLEGDFTFLDFFPSGKYHFISLELFLPYFSELTKNTPKTFLFRSRKYQAKLFIHMAWFGQYFYT